MSKYRDVLDALKDDEQDALGLSVLNASKKDPDKQAEIIHLSERQTLPEDTVERNLSEVKQRERLNSIDLTSLRDRNPVLAAFLSDKNNAALAIDDLDNLSRFENSITAAERQGLLEKMWRGAGETSNTMIGNLMTFFTGLEKDVTDWTIEQAQEELARATDEDTRARIQNRLGKLLKNRAELEPQRQQVESTGQGIKARGKEFFDYHPKYTIDRLLENPTAGNLAGMIAEQGVVSLPYMIEAMISLPAMAVSMAENIAEERAENQGQDEITAEDRLVGLGAAVPIAALEKIGALAVFKQGDVTGVKSLLKEIWKSAGTEGLTEFVQEPLEYLAEVLGTDQTLTWEEAGKRALSGLLVGAGMGTSIRSVSGAEELVRNHTNRDFTQAFESALDQKTIDDVITLSQSSVLHGRAPERLKQFIDTLADESAVYIPATEVQALVEQNVELPPVIAEQLDLALETDGDIEIPMGDFVTQIAVDEQLVEQLRPHIRTKADGLSQNDMAQQGDASLKTLLEKAQADQDIKTEADEIYEQVKDQIVATGRQSEATAKYSAAIIPAYVAVKAKEHGKSVKEIYERMGLRVAGPMADLSGDTLKQSIQIKTPEFQNWFGDSKVVDQKGEPLVVYHGTYSPEFTEFKEGASSYTMEKGFYFTRDTEYAGIYATRLAENVNALPESARILPAYIKMNNPLFVLTKPYGDNGFDQKALDKLKEQGYDGIIVGMTEYEYEKGYKTISDHAEEVVAFEPTQIKSAIGNRGTFDPNDLNILHQDKIKPAGVSFVSPNIEEDTDFTYAQKELSGQRQADLKEFTTQVNQVLELPAALHDGIGDWADGAENTLITEYTNADFNTLRLAAALEGIYADQKAVIPFVLDDNGKSAIYDLELPVKPIESRAILDKAGIQFRTLIETEKGTRVLVFDEETELVETIEKFADEQGIEYTIRIGHGEFLGSWDSREEGRARYREIIQAEIEARQDPESEGLRDKGLQHSRTERLRTLLSEADAYQQASKPLFQATEAQTRGAFLGADEQNIIRLGKASDLSTFLHESGHLFMQMERQFADEYGASETQVALLKWLGVESFDDIDISTPEGIAIEEKFARGFEAYLREGKAPSLKLRDAFAAFARWLKRIYQNLRMLNVELNQDIRDVFDRMLATEEEITLARNSPAYDQFFQSAEQAGMTHAEWQAYQERVKRSRNKSEQSLDQKLLKELTRRKSWEWKEEKQPLIAEEKERLSKEPVYQVLRDIRSDALDYDEVRQVLNVTKLPGKLIGKAKKGGAALSEYAEVYGYPSSEAMLNDILAAPTLNNAADAVAEARMIEKYGDILNDGSIEAEAREAVHNEEQAKLLLEEVRALGKKSSRPQINREYLKNQARDMIGSLRFGDIRPDKYYRAEIRAAQKAVTTQTDEDALTAKTQQLVNHYLYREAVAAKQQIEKYRKYVKGVQDRDYSTTQVDASYVQNMKTLANLYDMRKSPQQTKNLDDFLNWYLTQINDENEFIKVELLDPSLVLALEAKQNGKLSQFTVPAYKDLTTEQLRGLYEMLRHLRYVGGQMADLEKAEFKAEKEAMVNSIIDNGGRDRARPDEPQRGDEWLSRSRSFMLELVNLRNLIRKLDGMQEDGNAFRQIYQVIQAANNEHIDLNAEVAKRFRAELSELSTFNIGRSDKRTIQKEGGGELTLSAEGRVMLALYWGVQSSREAVMAGHGITEGDVEQMLSKLTQPELALVNKIWKLNESLWPAMSEMAVRLYGVSPTKLEPTPFTVNGVPMTGGHMRLFYAHTPVELDVNEEKLAASAPLSQTKAGSLNERVGSGGKRVLLDKSNIVRSLNENVHAIAFAEATKQIGRLVNNREVKEAVIQKHGREFYETLVKSIDGIMTMKKERDYQQFIASLSKLIRHAATFKHLGYSIRNTAQQLSALPIAAQEVGAGDLTHEYIKFVSDYRVYTDEINNMSSFMKHRASMVNREASEQLAQISEGSKWQLFKQFSFAPQTFMDSLIAYPVWMAKYRQGMEEHGDHKKAITDADQAVAESVGSGSDLHLGSLFQSKRSELTRMVTIFGSWFNAYYNRLYRAYERGDRRIDGELVQTAITTPFVVGMLAALLIMDAPEDEEEWEEWALRTYGEFILATTPLIREIVSAYKGFTPKIPVASAMEGLLRIPQELDKMMEGDQSALKTFGDVSKGVTTFVPIPGAGQVTRMIDYWDSFEQGKEGDFNPFQMVLEGKNRN